MHINGVEIRLNPKFKARDMFYALNLSIEALQDAVSEATGKTGIDSSEIKIERCEDRSDSWMEYLGVRLSSDDENLVARTINFLEKYVKKASEKFYRKFPSDGRLRYGVHKVDPENGILLYQSFLIDD